MQILVEQQSLTPEKFPNKETIAEYVIGFLFAAHKNPSIALAQSLVFLLHDRDMLQQVLEELQVIYNVNNVEEISGSTFISTINKNDQQF